MGRFILGFFLHTGWTGGRAPSCIENRVPLYEAYHCMFGPGTGCNKDLRFAIALAESDKRGEGGREAWPRSRITTFGPLKAPGQRKPGSGVATTPFVFFFLLL